MKNIIITGTSRGIGFELVKILGQQHNILALSRETKSVEELSLPNVDCIKFDITNKKDFEKVVHFIKKKWNQNVDVLINNAGKLINKPFDKLSYKDFHSVYDVNVFGVVRLIQETLPFLKKGSNVLNISSIGGVQGSIKFAGLSAYSSSKGALITLTELLSEEYKNEGIIFNVMALGAVQTQMLKEVFPTYQAQTQPKDVAQYISDFVLNHYKLFNGKLIQVANTTP